MKPNKTTLPDGLKPTDIDHPDVIEKRKAYYLSAMKAAQQLHESVTPDNTQLASEQALAYWKAWFYLAYGIVMPYPLPDDVVATFVSQHLHAKNNDHVSELPYFIDQALIDMGIKQKPGQLSLSTVKQRLSLLNKQYQLLGLQNTVYSPVVKAMLSAQKSLSQKKQSPYLTHEEMTTLLNRINTSTLRGLRDKAMLACAYGSGGRRVSELCTMLYDDLKPYSDPETGETYYILTLSKTKTNPSYDDAFYVPIRNDYAKILTDWLTRGNIHEGAVFRRISKSDHVLEHPLSRSGASQIIKERVNKSGFSSHGLRSSFIMRALEKNHPLNLIMDMTTHKSLSSLMIYKRKTDPKINPCADLD